MRIYLSDHISEGLEIAGHAECTVGGILDPALSSPVRAERTLARRMRQPLTDHLMRNQPANSRLINRRNDLGMTRYHQALEEEKHSDISYP